MIHVIATIELNPGTRQAFLAEFHRLMPSVHAEAGCRHYEPAIDIPTGIPAQGPLRENTVIIVEQWDSLDHLRDHLAAPHMAEYRERVKDYVSRVSLQVVEPA